MIGPDLLGEAQTVLADIGGDDRGRTGRARDRGGKEAGRSASRDQHRMSGHVVDQGRIDGIPERLLDRGILRRNGLGRVPEDVLRQHDIVRKGSITVHAEDLVVAADVRLAGTALKTRSTREVRLCGDVVADLRPASPTEPTSTTSPHIS